MPTTEVVHLSLLQLQLFTPTLAHKAYSRVGRESTTQQLCKDDLNSPTQNLCRATYITDLRAFSIHSNPHRIGLNILPLANLDVFLCPFKSFPLIQYEYLKCCGATPQSGMVLFVCFFHWNEKPLLPILTKKQY